MEIPLLGKGADDYFGRPAILRLKSASLPDLAFEFHPGVRKLYVVRLAGAGPSGGGVDRAEIMANDVADPASAKCLVEAFTAGVRFARFISSQQAG